MKPGENLEQNQALREADDYQHENGFPILSVLIHMDTGPYDLSSVTEQSIKKFNLAKPGETWEQTVDRLREEAHQWASTKH